MRKFITNFLLIFSLACISYAQDGNTTIVNKIIKAVDGSLGLDFNKSQEEANKTEEKKQIVKIITKNTTQDDANSTVNTEIAEIIADKIVESQGSKIQDNKNDITLISTVNQIKQMNSQINILKIQKNDINATSPEIKAIIHAKNSLLEKLPLAITNQNIDKDTLLRYIEKKNNLIKAVDKNKNRPNSKEYVSAVLDLQNMEMSELFYTTLMKIEKMFVEGTSKTNLAKELQKALLDIQTKDYINMEAVKELLSQEQKIKFETKIIEIQNDKASYEEILSYLLRNTDLLASNVFFTGLNLKAVIDYINARVPFNTDKINVGKIILIVLITVLFYSLRKFLANIIYFTFRIFYKKSKENDIIKIQVIDIIKKPLGVLLIAYAVDICLSIFFYPAPVPIRFSSIFSILYIVLYAWLIIEILDGYGIMVLSSFAKKSGRKEIINLIIKIFYIIIVIIAILLILSRLGFDVSAILASLGIGGLAVALATKDIIANFFASIMLLFDNSFSQGDWIVVGDVEGTVVETGLRKTAIRTSDNALVFVPNSKILEGNIKNWNRRKVGRQIKISIGLSYGTTSEQIKSCVDEIKQMLIDHPDIANSDDNALSSGSFRLRYRQNMVSVDDLAGYKSGLFVCLDEFADSSINILVYCFTKTIVFGEYLKVKEDVLFKIMKIIEKYDTDFAFPSRSLYIEKFPKIIYDNADKNSNESDYEFDS